MVKVTINGTCVEVPEKTTILEAAKKAEVKIPTLCYWKDLNEIGACRVCLVEVEGFDRLFSACNNTVADGMVIRTNTKKVRDARRTNIALILSEHRSDCTVCVRSGNCNLQRLANDMNLRNFAFEKRITVQKGNPDLPFSMDYTKCIKCMRCIQVCDKIQSVNVWDVINTGSNILVGVADAYTLSESKCTMCGQCVTHCSTGALAERDDTDKVMKAIHDPEKITVVQIAPSIRTAWGEFFEMGPEEATVNRLAACLKQIGADYVFDTNFTADLTIMEEGSEFLEKLSHKNSNKFPMFTSCCPGWVRFVKGHFPEFTDQLSTAKSPQQMFGAVAKSYYADILGVDPSKIFCVSIMPCVAKKHECDLPNMNDACGDPDVDAVLTTREVVRLFRSEQLEPKALKDIDLDVPLGTGSGAGNIFGATGGVMEAALRTAYALVTGRNPDPDAFKDVRGQDGWKEATFDLAGNKLNVAVVSGLRNARNMLNAIKNDEVSYDFVEVMACPGGCVGGGGQPMYDGVEMAPERADVLYVQDEENPLRFSHENPSIKAIYSKYLGTPLSERSHHLLHTDHHAWKMPGEE